MTLIVADAGPLIALSRIDQLELLRELFSKVWVPGMVLRELRLDEGRPGTGSLAQAFLQDRWIEAVESPAGSAVPGLDEGESAAILLAMAQDCPLFVDERRARIAARKRAVPVLGTGRVLLAAKQRGLIANVRDCLDALRGAGYRLSDDLCTRLLELSDEA